MVLLIFLEILLHILYLAREKYLMEEMSKKKYAEHKMKLIEDKLIASMFHASIPGDGIDYQRQALVINIKPKS